MWTAEVDFSVSLHPQLTLLWGFVVPNHSWNQKEPVCYFQFACRSSGRKALCMNPYSDLNVWVFVFFSYYHLSLIGVSDKCSPPFKSGSCFVASLVRRAGPVLAELKIRNKLRPSGLSTALEMKYRSALHCVLLRHHFGITEKISQCLCTFSSWRSSSLYWK